MNKSLINTANKNNFFSSDYDIFIPETSFLLNSVNFGRKIANKKSK